MTNATAWRLCAAAGLVTFVVSLAFGWVMGDVRVCGSTGGAGPIIAFELVRSPADMLTLFGSDPECQRGFAAMQARALWLDLLAFIPAYASFIAFGALAWRGSYARAAKVAAGLLIVAGLLDEFEGVALFQLLAALPAPQPSGWYDILFWTVRPKFALLSVGELMIAVMMLRGTWLARIAAVPIAWGGAVSLWCLFVMPRNPMMMEGHRWAWTALLVVALIAAIRPALVTRAEPA